MKQTYPWFKWGKDSAALAVHMNKKYPDLNIEYFFTDTGYELKETYDF